MDLTHRIAVAHLNEGATQGNSEEERQAIAAWAARLSAGQVHRLWQLLLKGYDEVRTAPDPLVAAQMALLRVMHAADMPDPGKLEKLLKDAAERGLSAAPQASAPVAGDVTAPTNSSPSDAAQQSMPSPDI
jgi:DNA polymerase-3 subunit gamma/tau